MSFSGFGVADVETPYPAKTFSRRWARDAEQLLHDIQHIVLKLGERFNKIYADLQQELRKHNIELIDNFKLTDAQAQWARSFYRSEIQRHLSPIILSAEKLNWQSTVQR